MFETTNDCQNFLTNQWQYPDQNCCNNSTTRSNMKQILSNSDLLPAIINNLNNGDLESQRRTARLFDYLTHGVRNDTIQKIIAIGVIEHLCSLIVCRDAKTVEVSS